MGLAQERLYTEDDYYNLPDNVRAELIDGQFYNMSSPSRLHQSILGDLYFIIKQYIHQKKGACKIYPAPFAVKLFSDRSTIVEPDISVICDKNKLTDRGCSGAPDWIIEIVSPSNAKHDHIRKLNLYRDAGVREYWIVDPDEQAVLIYNFEHKTFESSTFSDTLRAGIYDDLFIDFSKFDLV